MLPELLKQVRYRAVHFLSTARFKLLHWPPKEILEMIFVVSLQSALARLAFTMTTFPWAAILALWGRNRPWNRLLNGPTFKLWAHSPTDLECLVVCWVSRDSLQILNNDAAAPNNDKRRIQSARAEAGRTIKKRKVVLCCWEKREFKIWVDEKAKREAEKLALALTSVDGEVRY